MKVIYNKIIPFKGYKCINLFLNTLKNSFAGTFIHWELNFNNVNINYE